MQHSKYFRRPQLAQQLADQVLATGSLSAASSGVFLAAPRRTGKSTFLREDLRPALEQQGAFVLYVDLWKDRDADPGELIVASVRSALSEFDSVLTKLAQKTGIRGVTAEPVTFALEQVGVGTGVSLSDALAELSDELQQPIVLIIDEAQHAIVSDKGYDALFALKAARDELNSTAHFGLRVIATGSNRDKLAMLRNSKDQAFFGAPLVEFPPLGADYVAWFCERVNLQTSLDPQRVGDLFAKASFRPEILNGSADQLRFNFSVAAADLNDGFAEAVQSQIDEAEGQALRVINALTPLQSSVLRVLAARRDQYAPFTAETMMAYRSVLIDIAPKETVIPDTSNVQQALVALQDKMLVWKERRGVYALEESATAELLLRHGLLKSIPPNP
jgi:hypothetical protein